MLHGHQLLLVQGVLNELLLDLTAFLLVELEEPLTLLLHLALVSVDEDGLHDHLVEAVEVLGAAGVLLLGLLVWL